MRTFLSYAVIFMAYSGTAQVSEQLFQFQQTHPEVSFYEENDYNNLSTIEKEIIGENVIVFSQDINQSDLSLYNYSTAKQNQSNQQETNPNSDVIKVWLSNHTDVKIVPQSMYLEGNQAMRDEYLQNDCLILLGDTVTLEDIKNYQLTH